jgi:hypothetical protein
MRKAVAIVCITSFFALQYGKLVSYWHCRINAAVAAAICDCEKNLADVHKEGTPLANATATAKEKYEEVYLFRELPGSYTLLPVLLNSRIPMYAAVIPQGYTKAIFQPPRA